MSLNEQITFHNVGGSHPTCEGTRAKTDWVTRLYSRKKKNCIEEIAIKKIKEIKENVAKLVSCKTPTMSVYKTVCSFCIICGSTLTLCQSYSSMPYCLAKY